MPPQKTSSSWDPLLLISEIVTMQSLHYLTMSFIVPPLLIFFAEPMSLEYEGGASSIGMIMDWREMAGRPTVRMSDFWTNYRWAWSGGKKVGYGFDQSHWNGQIDPMRGWIIALCWLATSCADIYYLYLIVRRPRLILDFALTLLFNHLVLTTYYSASLPTSLFFYLILFGGTAATIIVAEQLCIRREMRDGLKVSPIRTDEEEGLVDDMELDNLRRD